MSALSGIEAAANMVSCFTQLSRPADVRMPHHARLAVVVGFGGKLTLCAPLAG